MSWACKTSKTQVLRRFNRSKSVENIHLLYYRPVIYNFILKMLGLLNRSQLSQGSVFYSSCQPLKIDHPANKMKKFRRRLDRHSRIVVETLCFLHPTLQTFPKLLQLKSWSSTFAGFFRRSFLFTVKPFFVCGVKRYKKVSLQFAQLELVFFAVISTGKWSFKAKCFRALKSIGMWRV